MNELSKQSKYCLSRKDIILSAINCLRSDCGEIFEEVQRHLIKKGWLCRRYGKPLEMLQFYKKEWPNSESQIHYEVRWEDPFSGNSYVDICLHIEEGLPNQKDVCHRIRQNMFSYSLKILNLLEKCKPYMPDEPIHDIIKGSLPLIDISVTALCNILDNLIETESFVDEALLLAGKEKVWRTEFNPNDLIPDMNWWYRDNQFGDVGGWKLSDNGGRIDGPCLKCFGNKYNYPTKTKEWNILWLLNPKTRFHEFSSGHDVYVSAMVHSSDGGKIRFYAEATNEGNWQKAFDVTFDLQPINQWQLIKWEGKISEPEAYNFKEQGLHAFIMVKQPEIGLKIDSIEIGI